MTIRENKPPNPERPQPRFAPGPLGRGVYLADLVRWLMEKHEATRVHVVKEYLCPVMLEKQPLFGDVKRSGDATPISDGAEWSMTGSGYVEKVSPKSGPSLRTVLTGANRFRVEHVTVNTDSIGKGVDAAVKWLLDRWGFDRNMDAIMDIDTRASWLAVSEADARRCWGWRGADEAAPAVDVVAKATDASPAVDQAANPAEASDDEPVWLTAKNYNVAWLLSERDRFKKLHGERGHYMKKLVAHLKALGVDVPGKDPAREIRRAVDAGTGKKKKKEAATFVSGLVGRKSGGTC